MKTNVRMYTDQELLNRVKAVPGFRGYPEDYWVLAVASNENQADVFDDKFYVFKGKQFVMVTSGTINTGTYGLLNWKKWSKQGAFVIKLNQWIYDMWKTGHMHKGKMLSLGQIAPVEGYRDSDMDKKAEQSGKLVKGVFGINLHTVTYKMIEIVKKAIGAWSVGCQVWNDTKDYYRFMDLVTDYQEKVSFCIVEEFDPEPYR